MNPIKICWINKFKLSVLMQFSSILLNGCTTAIVKVVDSSNIQQEFLDQTSINKWFIKSYEIEELKRAISHQYSYRDATKDLLRGDDKYIIVSNSTANDLLTTIRYYNDNLYNLQICNAKLNYLDSYLSKYNEIIRQQK